MIENTPLVSCVIIFLNTAKYLDEAIESVLAQTYRNWELFLVDDGSTDESTAITQAYAREYPDKVYYLAHENHANRGKNASRNLGIAHARGKYIALLDGDDIWLPEKLAEQVALLEQYPEAGMLYGRTQIWLSWNDAARDKKEDSLVDLGVVPNTLIQPPDLFLRLLQGNSQTPTTCNAILRKRVFHEIGGFDESYHDIMEDQIFFAKVELAYPVYVADNVWARYRKHVESSFMQYAQSVTKDRSIHYVTRLKFLHWVENHLKKEDVQHELVWLYLRNLQQSLQRKLRWLQLPIVGPCLKIYLHLRYQFATLVKTVIRQEKNV